MATLAISPATLASLIIAISFAAGLNVYAAVCTLGIMARLHWVVLPGELGALAHPWMIAVSAVAILSVLLIAALWHSFFRIRTALRRLFPPPAKPRDAQHSTLSS